MSNCKIAGILILLLININAFANATKQNFRFNIATEPHSLDPARLSGAETSFLSSNILRGLYFYSDVKGIQPLGAKSCQLIENPFRITCQLNTLHKWSDGKPVLAKDYIFAFQRLVDPNTKAKDAGLLLNLRHAKLILEGKKPAQELGVSSRKDDELIFEFDTPDYDFIAKLSSPILVPLRVVTQKERPESFLSNGPYQISEWIPGKKMALKPNVHYPWANKDRPWLDVFFIEESTTAMSLYDSGQLDMVLYFPTSLSKAYMKNPEHIRSPTARFDYIGFSESLNDLPKLREALIYSIDYEEFKKTFDALGRSGCPGLPDSYMDKIPCYNFDLNRAKKALSKVSPEEIKKAELVLSFTKYATDDLLRVAEWYQHQWKKNLDIDIQLRSKELGMYRNELKSKPSSLFRTGVGLDRPSCLAALEIFHSDSQDNYLRLKSKVFDEKLMKLSRAKTESSRKKNCSDAIQYLLDQHRMIPQGKIHFSRLVKSQFTGYQFITTGALDLSYLSYKK